MTRAKLNFTLGIDGEFTMQDKLGQPIYLPDYLAKNDDFGMDEHGAQNTVEIRSKAGDARKVVSSIKDIITKEINCCPELLDFTWLCGSFVNKLPLGTHIHFGHKADIDLTDFGTILDNYIGSISILLEDKKEAVNRRKYSLTPGGNNVSYGKSSDIRTVKHPTLKRWEYRSCGSFLHSPEICEGILSLVEILFFEYLNVPKSRFIKFITPDVLLEKKWKGDFSQVRTAHIRKFISDIISHYQKMELFFEHASRVNIIFDAIQRQLSYLDIVKSMDMKVNWGISIPKIEVPIIKTPKLKKHTNKELYVNDVGNLNVSYNPQKKVISTVNNNELLYENIAKLNAKLKKNKKVKPFKYLPVPDPVNAGDILW